MMVMTVAFVLGGIMIAATVMSLLHKVKNRFKKGLFQILLIDIVNIAVSIIFIFATVGSAASALGVVAFAYATVSIGMFFFGR